MSNVPWDMPTSDRNEYERIAAIEPLARTEHEEMIKRYIDYCLNLLQTLDELIEERNIDFARGIQVMREMLARFVEQDGDSITAISIRANWNPSWGKDPGKPEDVELI